MIDTPSENENQTSSNDPNITPESVGQNPSEQSSETGPTPEQKQDETKNDVVPEQKKEEVSLSGEVEQFVNAGKRLLDSLFSEITHRIEQRLADYLKNFRK